MRTVHYEREPRRLTIPAMNAGRPVPVRLAEIGIRDEAYTAFLRRHEAATRVSPAVVERGHRHLLQRASTAAKLGQLA
jgi:hypothetical protein